MRKRHHDTKRAPGQTAEKEIPVTFSLNEDDARDLERHAKRLGVSVDTMLNAAIALCNRELSADPVPAATVEYLAKRGFSILRKRDLN